MKIFTSTSSLLILVLAFALVASGCASSKDKQSDEARGHFIAGQEEAFATMQRSGILLVRLIGPFQRPVILWQPEMTLAEAIVDAGYLENQDPSQILIQRGAEVFDVAAAQPESIEN